MDIKIINLRAIAILIVVLGHSIILYDPAWGIYHSDITMPLFLFLKRYLINPIQMPIFFFISGFLFYHSITGKKDLSLKRFFRSKIFRLIVPYFCIAFLWMDPIKWIVGAPGFEEISNFKSIVFYQTTFSGYLGHLWYLPTLFGVFSISFLCFYLLSRIFSTSNNTYIHIGLFILFLLLHNFAHYFPTTLCFSLIANYLVYFQGGVLFNLLTTNQFPFPIKKLTTTTTILCWSIALLGAIYFAKVRVIFVLLFIFLSYMLLPSRTNNFINNISKNSYGIYLFHSPLIYITYTYFTNANPIFVVFLNFVVMGTISYILTVYISKTKFKFIIGGK